MGNDSCTVRILSNYVGKYKMPKKAENPLKMVYDPELNSSQELDPDAVSYSLTMIGILRWMIELGRIDIITKLSLLLFHVALPKEGFKGSNTCHGPCWSEI